MVDPAVVELDVGAVVVMDPSPLATGMVPSSDDISIISKKKQTTTTLGQRAKM